MTSSECPFSIIASFIASFTLRDSNHRYAKQGLRKFEEVFNLLLISVLYI